MYSALHQFAVAMPKVELHVHLEGAMLPSTLLELARRHAVELPANSEAGLRDWYQFKDFNHFISIYLAITSCLRSAEDFALIAYDFGCELKRQNIRYAEATFTPYLHLWQNKGLDAEAIISGLESGRQRVKKELDVEIGWVPDIPRNLSFDGTHYHGKASDATVEMALAWQPYGVVALGLGGNEVGAPPEPFAHAFDAARAGGLRSVPHAGETMGAESVWGALQALRADRIGHGVRAVEDVALIDYLVQEQIPLEVNPSSNVCLGVYPDLTYHPLRQLWDAGVYITVNSDDPPLFNTTLNREYILLIDNFGFAADDLERVSLNALHASFLPLERKTELQEEFQAEFSQLRAAYGLQE